MVHPRMELPTSISKYLRSNSGQSVILISMVIMSFLLFMGFAINTGVLVTAKISVQSAADAAAYAGAATQARQLNAISFLNYDMRRQFKKFMHRYTYIGNVSAPGFPNAGGASGDYPYPKKYFNGPGSPAQTVNLNIPVVCIPLTGTNTASDACLFLNLPNSTNTASGVFKGGGLTAISKAFLEASKQISEIMISNCSKQGALNLMVVNMWLFRATIDQASIENFVALSDPANKKIAESLHYLTSGLGLYPRNIINTMRIQTLEKMVNDGPKVDVDRELITGLEKSPSAETNERTIQAFKSALSNLNNEVLNHESVILNELQPANQIILTAVKPSFTTYFQMAQKAQNSTDPNICVTEILGMPAPFVPVGFNKTGNPYYSVKVRAKAKLMFSPIKDGIELEAVASAKPFGSRIGPTRLIENEFEKPFGVTQNPATNANINKDCSINDGILCKIPRMPITLDKNFMSTEYLKAIHQVAALQGGSNFVLDQSGGGLFQATSPMPVEVGKYNILPTPNDSPSEFLEFSADDGANSKVYRFYAPLFDQKGGDSAILSTINNTFDAIFGKTGISQIGTIDFQQIKQQVQEQLTAYVRDKLPQGGDETEHGETQTFASIELPMAENVSGNQFWIADDQAVKTSWAPTISGKLTPRFGYSVKFVASRKPSESGPPVLDDDADNFQH